jgi:hypothetical protein
MRSGDWFVGLPRKPNCLSTKFPDQFAQSFQFLNLNCPTTRLAHYQIWYTVRSRNACIFKM